MRFKQRQSSQPTEINLIPMLDVLMTVLTFFIIISMTLALEQGVEVQLPSNQSAASADPAPDPLTVTLNGQGILLNDRSTPQPQLLQQVKQYLAANPNGVVVLQADPKMSYEQVIDLLTQMKVVGGDRVALAIE